jgi:hypothetical protein
VRTEVLMLWALVPEKKTRDEAFLLFFFCRGGDLRGEDEDIWCGPCRAADFTAAAG